MSKKLSTAALKRPSTRSLASTKPSQLPEDKYTFQSDDEDHQIKPTLARKSLASKRVRARPAVGKSAAQRSSSSSSSSSSASEPEEKKRPLKRNYEKPVTRRASRLGSQTNTPVRQIRDKIKINSTPPILITPKKRARKIKMFSTQPSSTPDEQQKTETENVMPSSPAGKRRVTKKSTEDTAAAAVTPPTKTRMVDDKDLMQFGSPEQEEFSDDSVEFVWKGSSKMSIEILKRRIPKDEPREHYAASSIHSDPTAQRKRAIIPRLNNFDALSGKPVENSPSKSTNSVATSNSAFQNDFDYSYADKGARAGGNDDKSRPRVYAVKSTTMKARLQPTGSTSTDIKRPKWMNDQQGKSEDDDRHLSNATGEEPADYDYNSKEQYPSKRPAFRGRGTFPVRRGTGMRGRPPGSRRNWNNDDDDDDYDQYEDNNARYGPRKHLAYRPPRSAYDMPGGEDDEYDKSRRMSLTQAYRRNSDMRQPTSNPNNNRRLPMNNGNHKDDHYYSQGGAGRSVGPNRLSASNTTSMNSGNTFVAKINDAQLSEVANQSQIFFVNVPQQDQKNQQVLSVLASEQQQVLPVALVQQAKVETSSSSGNVNSQNQTLAFTVKLPVDTPKQKKILPKPSSANNAGGSASNSSSKPFPWSRPPGRLPLMNEEQASGKGLTITPINTDLDTMEAAHVLATAADVTMAADARRKAQQHDDDMAMMVDETPSNVTNEETVQCEEDGQKNQTQSMGSITANIIDENGVEHTVILSTEEAQQLLGSQGAIIVDSDGQPISIQPSQTQTFLSPFALDQVQLHALLTQAGIDPNTPLTIEQIDPNQQQQQQVATLCTSPGGTQYTVLTQGPVQQQTQQQFILQTAPMHEAPAPPPPPPQLIAPKEDPSSPPKRRAFAVKSSAPPSTDSFDDVTTNERPRRKIFATKSTVASIEHEEEEGIIGTRAYHRK